MKIAVEGCAHGELDKIYDAIEHLQRQNSIKIDLLIICGDFQSVRNPADLECMAVPPKYKKLNTFYKYYSGKKKAPILTIFVGGNHEASNYLSELPYGGWVCPNIYYLGYANVINIGGIRIAGLSGIYKGRDYIKGHYEFPPYNYDSKKSVYHVRNIDVFRLKQIRQPIDIFLSHDWPKGVYNFGDKDDLLRKKPFFRDEVLKYNTLGSPPAEELLMKLKPSYWFAAHLHCKFAAMIPHDVNGKKVFTKFLALDKCLPRRKFLQVIDIESTSDVSDLKYDPEWLSILHLTNHLGSFTSLNFYPPAEGYGERWDFSPSDEEIGAVHNMFDGNFKIPDNFCVTGPTYDPAQKNMRNIQIIPYTNPQTDKFCEILGLTNPIANLINNYNFTEKITNRSFNPDELQLSDDSNSASDFQTSTTDIDTSGCQEFFIDRLGTHSNSKAESSVGSVLENFSFPEIKETNAECNKTDVCDEEPQPMKKFKRRNLSLYKSDENDL